jgi:hypothetical protein
MFIVSNQCIPPKNTLCHSVVVSHMSELLILSVIFCLIIPVHKFWLQVCYKLHTSQMATSGKWHVQWKRLMFFTRCVYFPKINGSLSEQHAMSSGCGWRKGLQYGGYLRIYWISSRGQPARGGHTDWGLGEVLTLPHSKNSPCYKTDICASGLHWSFGTT